MATLTAPAIDDLITDVRTTLGQPSAQNSTWTDEELTQYLNEAVRRYFVEAVKHMEGAFVTTTTLESTQDTETIALPSDFFKIKNLYIKRSQGYDILQYRNNLTAGFSTAGGTGSETYTPDYYLRGTSLVLHPTPNYTSTGGTFLLEYVQFPTTMITGGDSLTTQVSPIFKDLVVMYAVYKAKMRESLTSGVDTSALALQNLNDLFTAFKEIIGQMSANPTYVTPWNPEFE
jgi:hypothetical protein